MLERFAVLAFALHASVFAAPPAPPPPLPIVTLPATESRDLPVLTWEASDVTCASGAIITPAAFVAPDPQLFVTRMQPSLAPITISFALDADGRPQGMTGSAEPRWRLQMRDLMPSLRASRFAVQASQTGCTITYTPQTTSIAEAPLETLARFGVAQRLRMGKEVWNRISPGTCNDTPRLAPLSRAFPDFRKLVRREGRREWTYVTYDVDSDGVPVNLATLLTSGYGALDDEARAAAAAGRYAGGPRTGCMQAWWTGPETIPAPPMPPKSEPEGNPACEIKDRWDRQPRLVFPTTYQQRAIEGWAILRFDVAPWGEIGSIEVLDAQPSSEFGEAAVGVIRNARFKPQESGLKGCIDRVIFRIRGAQDHSDSEEPAIAD
jgi:TonB family protein